MASDEEAIVDVLQGKTRKRGTTRCRDGMSTMHRDRLVRAPADVARAAEVGRMIWSLLWPEMRDVASGVEKPGFLDTGSPATGDLFVVVLAKASTKRASTPSRCSAEPTTAEVVDALGSPNQMSGVPCWNP